MSVPMIPLAVGDVPNIPVFDIRNGPVADARNIYVRPTIAAAYRWVGVRNLPVNDAAENVGAFIRSAWAQISLNAPAGMDAATQRKVAIVLGVGRSIMTTFYQINVNDLTPGELAEYIYEWDSPPAPAGAPPGQPAAPPVLQTVAGAAPNRVAAAQAFGALTAEEEAVAATLSTCMVGALPLQGYSLIMTSHHYLSDKLSQSRRAFDVVERQFWKAQAVSAWFGDHTDDIRDAAWHKAGHPVTITLKTALAKSDRVAQILVEAGVGSAAARLPAMEPELRAANSYKTLCATVRPLFEAYGGRLDYGALADAVELTELFPHGAQPLGVPQGFVLPPAVNDRASALAHLNRVLTSNSDVVAYCYGFYTALSDNNLMMGGTSQEDTLKSSYSLKKLKNQSYASFVAGSESFRDYQAAKSAARQAGRYNPPTLTLV